MSLFLPASAGVLLFPQGHRSAEQVPTYLEASGLM